MTAKGPSKREMQTLGILVSRGKYDEAYDLLERLYHSCLERGIEVDQRLKILHLALLGAEVQGLTDQE